MRTPVIFFIFNRPAHTARVFETIAHAAPEKLFIISDAPREGNHTDVERSAEVRKIVDRINWRCEVIRDYSDVNLGCGRRIASGLQWAFSQTEEAIILEDDTLPSSSFFPFCEELLEHYRDDDRIMHISGNNYCAPKFRSADSYHFSRYGHIWGWATWRRAFAHYDFEMKQWPQMRDTNWLLDLLGDKLAADWRRDCFDNAHTNDRSIYDSWDVQLTYSMWLKNGLSVTPNVNLVTNIGWDETATRTHPNDSAISKLPLEQMSFPIRHPKEIVIDRHADAAAFEVSCNPIRPRSRARVLLRSFVPTSLRQVLKAR
jgi:hypothetical protein